MILTHPQSKVRYTYAAPTIETPGISRYGVLLQVGFVKAVVKASIGKMNQCLMRADREAWRA